jgi:Mn-dependent DtxR family transcriptional regulator
LHKIIDISKAKNTFTNEEIAENMGCSTQTVIKKLKSLDGVPEDEI